MKKRMYNEQGIAQALLALIVVVVLVAIGLVGYEVYHKNHKTTASNTSNTSNSSSGSSNASADSSCLATYHDANLCHFASNSLDFNKTAYTAILTSTDPQGTVSNMTLSNDGKGNTELVTSANGQQISSITLNGNTYIQSGAGTTWIEYPSGSPGSSPAATNPTSNMNIGVGSTGITYKSLGTSACGSLTCYKYQVTDAASPGATQYAWFDNSSYQLREWQYSDSTSGTVTMDISYKSVTISTPSPVKSYTSVY